MDRRTAARVVPTAEPTASTCSSNSAVVFTPVVPVEHVADDRESGAASSSRYVSSSRYREDGQEYVSQPRDPCIPVCKVGRPIRSDLKCGTLLSMRSSAEASSSQPNEPTRASPERAASAVPAGASSSLKPAPLLHKLPRDVAEPLADSVIGA